ncbi:alpha/beta hydrolase [Hydrogenophaga sp. BPS33]|uniref:alpha/beta hydrolase n=1 Tax=Hydrogenophaga sp. BPS33 TaxID=2651974 RepID=UPI0013203A28|nr:alpha/beta hydrolase [Hydrogenophaga sp. BPS33]QHE88647.1 alpha/beta hydrolase [Hydrogenophaga sp. BPS33]
MTLTDLQPPSDGGDVFDNASPAYRPQPTPEMQRVLDILTERKKGQPSRYEISFEDARRALIEERKWWIETAPRMASAEEQQMVIEGRSVRMRRNLPIDAREDTEIIYLHGGGWCVGAIETHDAIVRGLADATRHPVLALDYSLAPEHPFPAAFHDLTRVLAALRRERPPGTRWVLAGDSAGANLALLEAMRARDAGERMPDALLLLYGAYLPVRPTRSYEAYADGRFGMSKAAMVRYEHHYLGGRLGESVPQAFPMFAGLRKLPPMLIGACELDVLFDDSLRLHQAVQDYGGHAELEVYRGAVHGFLTYGRMMEAPRQAFESMGRFLDRVLAVEPQALSA